MGWDGGEAADLHQAKLHKGSFYILIKHFSPYVYHLQVCGRRTGRQCTLALTIQVPQDLVEDRC